MTTEIRRRISLLINTAICGVPLKANDLSAERVLRDLRSIEGKPLIAISFGSPYVLHSIPEVPAYLLAWGGTPLSQRAAATALLGMNPITGKLPISLPPYYTLGAGIERPARTAPSR